MDDPRAAGAHAARAARASTSRASAPRAGRRGRAGLRDAGARGSTRAGRGGATSASRRDARRGRRGARATIAAGDRLVVFVGKLIVSKGVDLLLAAWPLVLRARAAGAAAWSSASARYRDGLERLVAALAAGDLDAVRAIAAQGGRARAARASRCVTCARSSTTTGDEAYLAAAARPARARLLRPAASSTPSWPTCCPRARRRSCPSTFPEAFGMVAAEAAACGALPVSSDHSGLAEVTAHAGGGGAPRRARWLVFARPATCRRAIAERCRAGCRRRRSCARRPARRSSRWRASATRGTASRGRRDRRRAGPAGRAAQPLTLARPCLRTSG